MFILLSLKGCCYGNRLILGVSNEFQLILPAFFALAFENKLQYHYLNARINSWGEATSCKNLVNFCLVTPEMTGLICTPMYLYWAKIDNTPSMKVCSRKVLHSSCCHSEMPLNVGMPMAELSVATIMLNCYTWYKFGELFTSNSRVCKTELCTASVDQHSG